MTAEIEVTVDRGAEVVTVQAVLPPTVESAADISTEVIGHDQLLLQLAGASGEGPSRLVPLPCAVDPDSARVRYKRATRTLTFTAQPAAPLEAATGDTASKAACTAPAPHGRRIDEASGAAVEARLSPEGTVASSASSGSPCGNGCNGLHGRCADAALSGSDLGAQPHADAHPRPPAALPRHETELPGPSPNSCAPQDPHLVTPSLPPPQQQPLPACHHSTTSAASHPAHAPSSNTPTASLPAPFPASSEATSPISHHEPEPRSPGAESADDATLYREFFCGSPSERDMGLLLPPVDTDGACHVPRGNGSAPCGSQALEAEGSAQQQQQQQQEVASRDADVAAHGAGQQQQEQQHCYQQRCNRDQACEESAEGEREVYVVGSRGGADGAAQVHAGGGADCAAGEASASERDGAGEDSNSGVSGKGCGARDRGSSKSISGSSSANGCGAAGDGRVCNGSGSHASAAGRAKDGKGSNAGGKGSKHAARPDGGGVSVAAAATVVNGGEGGGAFCGPGGTAVGDDVGTHYRPGGYDMAAPKGPALPLAAPAAPPPPPLPAGFPAAAPPIDCRYLAVANALRISAHAPTATLAELMGVRQRPSAAAAARQAARETEIVDRIVETLDAYGYAVLDNFISEGNVHEVRKELQPLEPHYSPGLIWVGREAQAGAQISVSDVRGDVVLWLDGAALGATAFVKNGVRRSCCFLNLQQMLADLDELVFDRLRHRLPYLAGMHRRSDAHLAIYPGGGARFAKHVDNTTLDGRRLTAVAYLNPGWGQQQGGELRLFPARQGAGPHVDVLPLPGRVALFLSAEVAHEVLPAHARRHAVTLWYYDAGEHAGALAAAQAVSAAGCSPAAQAAARELIRDLLADGAASTIHTTQEGCAALALRVASLESGAREVVAAVTGAPSAAALTESMQRLTPDRLAALRSSLRSMGLDTQHHAPDTSAHVSRP